MIISDLDHLEVSGEVKDIDGAVSNLLFNLEFLSLGVNNSQALIPVSEFLSTSSPGVNVASGKFTILLGAD